MREEIEDISEIPVEGVHNKYFLQQEKNASQLMRYSVDQVKKIARLSSLSVDDADLQSYATNLSNILDMVEQMNAIDTTGVTPMSHPFDAVQRLREDVVTEVDRREAFLKIAPKTEDGLYLVPKVLE